MPVSANLMGSKPFKCTARLGLGDREVKDKEISDTVLNVNLRVIVYMLYTNVFILQVVTVLHHQFLRLSRLKRKSEGRFV